MEIWQDFPWVYEVYWNMQKKKIADDKRTKISIRFEINLSLTALYLAMCRLPAFWCVYTYVRARCISAACVHQSMNG